MCVGYRSDLQKICDAERQSGVSMKADGAKVMDWMKRNVSSSDGVILVNELSTKDSHGKVIQLRGETRKYSVPTCALADSCEALAKDEDYKGDIANLCAGRAVLDDGSVARLDITDADDAERLREIAEWTRIHAKSSDTQGFVAKLGQAGPRDRGKVLRGEATRLAIPPPCGLADTFDRPPPPPFKPPPALGTPSFTLVKIDGGGRYQTVIENAIDDSDTSAAINSCYANGLTKVNKLAGKVAVKLIIDGKGKVTKASDDGSDLRDPGTVKCIVNVLLNNPLEKAPPDKGGVKLTVTLQLTPAPPDVNPFLQLPTAADLVGGKEPVAKKDGGAKH